MKTWSDRPFHGAVPVSRVPVGRILSENDGESRIVYEIKDHSEWLVKLYKSPLTDESATRLARLTELPEQMSHTQLTMVDSATAWPVAFVTEDSRTVGIVMAKAPSCFEARISKLSGAPSVSKPLPIDWLIKSGDACRRRDLVPADDMTRRAAVIVMLRIGMILDDFDLVYGDWSYQNAFWDQHSGSVFLIDMDSCGFGVRPWIESPEWNDPLFPDSRKALTPYSDYYKLAVFSIRCLTGERRNPQTALEILESRTGSTEFSGTLRRSLNAVRPDSRPGPYELLASFFRSVSLSPKPSPKASSDPAGAENPPPGQPGNVTGYVDLAARRRDQSRRK